MGIMTIVLDDRVERGLRERAARIHGSRKGALSASIQEAIESWLHTPVTQENKPKRLFQASRGGKILVEAVGLRELVEKLREARIDPRSVEISSSEPLKEVARMGVRLKQP